MQSGYFKVDATAENSAFIFPGRFVGATPVVELRAWLDHRGLRDPIVYVPSRIIIVPITEIGASA